MSRYLLIFDRSAGRIIESAEFAESKSALASRLEAEERYKEDQNVEVVVLTASSPEELRRTHARYFERFDEIAARGSHIAETASVTYDEYFGPRFAALHAYVARVKSGDHDLTEDEAQQLGRTITEIETAIDAVISDTPDETVRVRQSLRDLVESTRTHMHNDHKYLGLVVPDDPSALFD